MRCLLISLTALCLISLTALGVIGCAAKPIDIGAINQQSPPAPESIVAPTDDAGIDTVGLRYEVAGQLAGDDTRNVYILVNPLAVPGRWWVQKVVIRDGDKFVGSCQFGEGELGKGEYFAIVALATTEKLIEFPYCCPRFLGIGVPGLAARTADGTPKLPALRVCLVK